MPGSVWTPPPSPQLVLYDDGVTTPAGFVMGAWFNNITYPPGVLGGVPQPPTPVGLGFPSEGGTWPVNPLFPPAQIKRWWFSLFEGPPASVNAEGYNLDVLDHQPTDVGLGLVLTVDNPTDRYLTNSGILLKIRRWIELGAPPAQPPEDPGSGGTGGGGGLVTVPPRSRRSLFEKANPGFKARVVMVERYDHPGTVLLGDRVNITNPDFGWNPMPFIVDDIAIDWVASGSPSPRANLTCTYQCERIPGFLYPGTGGSTPEQDGIDPGVPRSAFMRFDVTGTGFGVGGFADDNEV